jgi:hypothetical protein
VRGHDGRFDQPQDGEGDKELNQCPVSRVSHGDPSQTVLPGHDDMVTRRGSGQSFML